MSGATVPAIPQTLEQLRKGNQLVLGPGSDAAPWWRWHGGQTSVLASAGRVLRAGRSKLEVESLSFVDFQLPLANRVYTLASPPEKATAAENFFGRVLTRFEGKPAYDQVVFAHAARSDAETLARLLYLDGGPTAPFVVSRDGRILQLYDPDLGAGRLGPWSAALQARQLGVMLLGLAHAPGNKMDVDYEVSTFDGQRGSFRGWRFFEDYPAAQRDAVARLAAYLSLKYGIPPVTLPPPLRYRVVGEERLTKAGFRGFLSACQLSRGQQAPETPGLWDETGLPPHWDWTAFLDKLVGLVGPAEQKRRLHHKQETAEVEDRELEGEPDAVRARVANALQKPDAQEPVFALASYRVAATGLTQLHLADKLRAAPGAARGQLDPSLSSASKEFQTAEQLEHTDGAPGPLTRKALHTATAALERPGPTERTAAKPHIMSANWGPLVDGRRPLELLLANVPDGRPLRAEVFSKQTKIAAFDAVSEGGRASLSLPVGQLARRHPEVRDGGMRVEAEVTVGTDKARRGFDSPGALEASSPHYGGFQLRLGDRDKDGVWGGKPRQKQGAFVEQLQRDLASLGYWVQPYMTPAGRNTPESLEVFSGVFDSLTRAALFLFQWEQAGERNRLDVPSIAGKPAAEADSWTLLKESLEEAKTRHDGQLDPETARLLKDAAQRRASRPGAPWLLTAAGGAVRMFQLPPSAFYWLSRAVSADEWLPYDGWFSRESLELLARASRTWAEAHPADKGARAIGLAGLPALNGKGDEGNQWDVVTPHLANLESADFEPEAALRFARHWLEAGVQNLVFNCPFVIESLKRWSGRNGRAPQQLRAAGSEQKSGACSMQMRSRVGPVTANRLLYCTKTGHQHPSRENPLTDPDKLCPHAATCPMAYPTGKYWQLNQGDKNRFADGLLAQGG